MIYPQNFEEKIGFDHIRQWLHTACLSSLGQEFVEKMRFSNRFADVQKKVQQTAEFQSIFHSGEDFPTRYFLDPNKFLKKVSIHGTFLSEEEMADLLKSLGTIFAILRFFDKNEQVYPSLFELRQSVKIAEEPFKEIADYFDAKWLIKDSASPDLRKLREAIRNTEHKARKLIESIFKTAKDNGYVPDGQSITIREGRLVVPLAAEHKRRVKGYIQDESATGQMIYMEPAESIELNNELRGYQYQERRELLKILTKLTDIIRPHLDELEKAYRFLGMIDFIRAKAKFAQLLTAISPQLDSKPLIDWRNAKNVVLMLNMDAEKEVVPLSLKLDHNKRILVISGPNAGGKSVALKTVGLLQYMLQCGLLVPMHPDSKCGIFQQILIDIGDEQSIENDLSTYSSHLRNMREFINRANKQSLFLIDEFGTGTEPQIGAAIAESVLDELYRFGSFGVITTHYDNIKHFADQHPQVINGAMRFDQDRLQPLFELEVGKPGSSFAIELAQKMGISNKILDKAKQITGTEKIDYDRMLNTLENEKQRAEKSRKAAEQKEKELKKLAEEYNSLKDFLEQQQKRIIKEAKNTAQQLIKDANKNIEQTIRQIKESNADKEKTNEARKELKTLEEKMKMEEVETKPKLIKASGEIQKGDSVIVDGQEEIIGEVVSVKGKEAQVILGALTTFIKLNRLIKVSKAKHRKQSRTAQPTKGVNLNDKRAEFSMDIDVRGQRVEEAVVTVDRFLDNAMMLSQSQVRILHGKGNGVLRTVIRDYIRQYNFVDRFENEHVEQGGDGITVVYLK